MSATFLPRYARGEGLVKHQRQHAVLPHGTTGERHAVLPHGTTGNPLGTTGNPHGTARNQHDTAGPHGIGPAAGGQRHREAGSESCGTWTTPMTVEGLALPQASTATIVTA